MGHQGIHSECVSAQRGQARISISAFEPRDRALSDPQPVGHLLLSEAEFPSPLDEPVQQRVILLHLLDGQGLSWIAPIHAD
jgi:hypothetical protein